MQCGERPQVLLSRRAIGGEPRVVRTQSERVCLAILLSSVLALLSLLSVVHSCNVTCSGPSSRKSRKRSSLTRRQPDTTTKSSSSTSALPTPQTSFTCVPVNTAKNLLPSCLVIHEHVIAIFQANFTKTANDLATYSYFYESGAESLPRVWTTKMIIIILYWYIRVWPPKSLTVHKTFSTSSTATIRRWCASRIRPRTSFTVRLATCLPQS